MQGGIDRFEGSQEGSNSSWWAKYLCPSAPRASCWAGRSEPLWQRFSPLSQWKQQGKWQSGADARLIRWAASLLQSPGCLWLVVHTQHCLVLFRSQSLNFVGLIPAQGRVKVPLCYKLRWAAGAILTWVFLFSLYFWFTLSLFASTDSPL